MGHDVHFLERLERVDVGQAERALGLYRNPELVRALLSELSLPEGADRIAVALDAVEPSPHVIVSRDGHFVTCLAGGMSLGGALRVTRPQLDGVRARHERLRAALDLSETGQLKAAFKRLADDAEYFPREDAQLVAAVHPLLGTRLALLGVDFFTAGVELAGRLASRGEPALRRPRLRSLWQVHWAYSVLLSGAMAQGAPPETLSTESLARQTVRTWMNQTACLALRATGARGLWALGRFARHALPEVKRIRAEASHPDLIAVANLVLGFVALRHGRYRAEITKVLQTPPRQDDPIPQRRELIAGLDALTSKPLLKLLADPDQARVESERELRAWKEGAFPEEEDAPGTLYFACYAERDGDEMTWPYECTPALPWLAQARFEDLFAARKTFNPEPAPQEAMEYLTRVTARALLGRRKPVRAAPRMSRNAPCGCGSGKKAKKCCAV